MDWERLGVRPPHARGLVQGIRCHGQAHGASGRRAQDKDGYHFDFEMPGLTNELIDSREENGRLLVAAERKRPEWPQETEVRIAERSYGTIHRAFELPNDASRDRIEANYKDGVLEVTVAKKPESNRRRF